jgi:p-hydroxybenzoate 3-monooxygenase
MRSKIRSRFYLQVDPDEDIKNWSDDRIWSELSKRMHVDGWRLQSGPIIEKGITPMRSFVSTPMRYGNLFLAGDAAHIVPPTGAKGLNLAIADVKVLSTALARALHFKDTSLIDSYSETALARVWRSTYFSWWMTSMLHTAGNGDPFDDQLQSAQIKAVVSSPSAMAALAENYVGIPFTSQS